MPTHPIRNRAIVLVLPVLFVLALTLRLFRLDAQSLWLDEGSTWQFTQLPWSGLLRDLFNPTAAYPLYHVLLKAWIGLFGDSEIALRLPSAIAAALAVVVVYLAASELDQFTVRSSQFAVRNVQPSAFSLQPSTLSIYGIGAALLTALGPFAIWYGQEAKVYSLLLLSAAATTWLALRALRTNIRRDWLLLGAVIVIGLFVHRLSALLVLAIGWAWVFTNAARSVQHAAWAQGEPRTRNREPGTEPWALRTGIHRLSPAILLLAGIGLIAAMARGLGDDRAATGAYIPASPFQALWLTFVRFSVDRNPGDAVWWWLLPFAALLLIGLWRLGLATYRGDRGATALLTIFGVPLILFSIQLLYTRLYEARYLMIIFPVWALVLAAGLRQEDTGNRETAEPRNRTQADPARPVPPTPLSLVSAFLLVLALTAGGMALVQPVYGIFSGDPVKEQYREAVGELALRVHPDDAVVLHPSYIRPLYNYYMGRFSSDPAPEPFTFGDFWQGETNYGQREWDIERRAKLAGFTRSFLLIAPEHARTVDQPLPGDAYGLVGNFWAFSREQRAWPCGIWRYNGAHLLCQEAPEPYYTGVAAPQPAMPSDARFGENLLFLGLTLKATMPDGPGVYRAGGVLPLSLFFDVIEPLAADYSLFLHLCQDCEVPPVAGEDGPPLEGYLPTSTWLPGKPARDDRAIALPADLPPGEYTLLLGIYDPTDPTPTGRLPVHGTDALGNGRLVLGTVTIVSAE
jgi:mannosyltransferase